MVDERGDVVGHQPHVERPVDVGGPAVPLQVDDDDLVVVGQGGKDRPEHLTRAEAAVQQDHRASRPVRLVVQVDAVDVGVLTRAGAFGGPFRGGHDDSLCVPGRRDAGYRPDGNRKLIAGGGRFFGRVGSIHTLRSWRVRRDVSARCDAPGGRATLAAARAEVLR